MNKLKIYKYEGLQNDFIITTEKVKNIVKLCDRKIGVGADGYINLSKKNSKYFMDFYNQDGSIAKMCGNGIRCYANFIHFLTKETKFDILTLDGIKEIEIIKIYNEYEKDVKVSMGLCKNFKEYKKECIMNRYFDLYYLDSGTDHVVIFVDNITINDVEKYSVEIQKLPYFKNGVNVNFVILNKSNETNIKVITYERGVGLTNACGTGNVACAYMYNKVYNGSNKIKVKNIGGELEIQLKKDNIYMIGNSRLVFIGEYYE